ncbi:hypothetical protein U9M48_010933 [Paspalum notatum var. saurae]|uniref:Uncharacterized protein n=1 Tax=Paspalum notatum var. saurae TaxID=547442 RepID=A0AAQ3SVV9_PASNO
MATSDWAGNNGGARRVDEMKRISWLLVFSDEEEGRAVGRLLPFLDFAGNKSSQRKGREVPFAKDPTSQNSLVSEW